MVRTPVAAALALFAASICAAGEEDQSVAPMTIGDKAPAIEISHWLKGNKIEAFEPGKVYVLEFWATWCGPCRASIPHITELQEQYKDYDVTFIGVSDEKLKTVVGFLCKTSKEKLWNDQMKYTVATDPDKSVYTSYMKAAGQGGIPTVFIIGKDQGVEWIGHPMQMDDVLEKVVKDTWNRDEFKVTFAAKRKAADARAARESKIREAYQAGDFEAVVRLLDEIIEISPDQSDIKFRKFAILLKELDKPQQAYAIGAELAEQNWDNAFMLNRLAWFIADEGGIKTRDLKLALKAAERANELTEGKDAAILDTVARVYYESGDFASAIKWQKKAVKHAEDSPFEEQIKETLEKYEAEAEDN